MRPTRITDIVGQEQTKKIVRILVDSAKHRDAAIPHQLFGGNAGTGKTTFALAIGNELNSNVILANAGNISNFSQLNRYINGIKRKDVLFIDEIHRLSTATCETLYHIMEDFRYTTTDGYYSREVHLPEFTLIGATTHVGMIPKPLRDRFKYIHNFSPYTLDELGEIVKLVFKENNINIQDTPNFSISKMIAQTCRGNPRHVVNRAEWVRDYILTRGKDKSTGSTINKAIDKNELKKAINMSGFDEHGFTIADKRYVEVLNIAGQSSLKTLVSKTGIDELTIMNEIEPFLMSLGLISISTGGRSLNRKKALEYNLIQQSIMDQLISQYH